MPLPSYVPVRSVSVGGATVLESAALLRVQVTVTASRPLVWAATGYRFENVGTQSTSEPGSEVVLTLPRTDVQGWKDGRSGAILDVSAEGAYSHRYIAQVRYLDEAGRSSGVPFTIGPFVLPEGDGVLDLDTTVPAPTVAGDAVSVPDSWGADVLAARAAAEAAEAALASIGQATVAPEPQTVARRTSTGALAVGAPTADEHAARMTEVAPQVLASSARGSLGRRDNRVVNLLTNPAMLTDPAGWVTSGYGTGGAGTASRVEGAGHDGSPGWVTAWTTAPTGGGANLGPYNARAPVVGGQVYRASIHTKASATMSIGVRLSWFTADSGSAFAGSFDAIIEVPAGTTRRFSAYATAPAGATFASVTARVNNLAGIGTATITVSRAMLTKGPRLTPYRDASFPDTAAGVSHVTAARSGFASMYGDSMTQLNYSGGTPVPTKLADLLGGVAITNEGRGGESSTGVAIRQGGLEVRVMPSTGQIPASGAVPCVVTPAGEHLPSAAFNYYGTVHGVPGKLTKAANDTWTFTRDAAGVAVDVLPGGEPFVPHTASDWADFHVIWVGHNAPTYEDVLRDVGAMVERCRLQGIGYLVLSPLTRTSQPAGSDGYTLMSRINAALAATYGAAFLDVRRYLIDHGLTVAGITPTPGDVTAISEDRIPVSLMHDDVHLNNAGLTVVARLLAMVVTARGMA